MILWYVDYFKCLQVGFWVWLGMFTFTSNNKSFKKVWQAEDWDHELSICSWSIGNCSPFNSTVFNPFFHFIQAIHRLQLFWGQSALIHQGIISLEPEEVQITGEVKCTSETWLPYHLQTSSPVEYHQGRET